MGPSRRQAAILDMVRSGGRTSIAELAESLRVSGETIRRNVRPLVETGMLVRSHGEVALADGLYEAPFVRRMGIRAAEKRGIGRAAAALVPDGATVMIDTGSTTAHAAEALAVLHRLTVITNSYEIARRFVGRNGHRVYLAGGEIRPDLSAVTGPEALAFLGQFRGDIAILSIGAVDPEHGFMDFHLDEARIARAMIERTDRALVLADHGKFGARAAVSAFDFGAGITLVSDRAPEPALAGALAATGTRVIVAASAA